MDQEFVWGCGSLHLEPGIMRLRKWTPSFDPFMEKSTTTQLGFGFIVCHESFGIHKFCLTLLDLSGFLYVLTNLQLMGILAILQEF